MKITPKEIVVQVPELVTEGWHSNMFPDESYSEAFETLGSIDLITVAQAHRAAINTTALPAFPN
jgi:hypothetical protein